MKPNNGNTQILYRDGTTFTAVMVIVRMGSDNEYHDAAIARFGHVPTGFEMKQAIERVRRHGVRIGTEAEDFSPVAWIQKNEEDVAQ